jgi:hypothetical protein
MSTDLVSTLRRVCSSSDAPLWVIDAAENAADRIEGLEIERDLNVRQCDAYRDIVKALESKVDVLEDEVARLNWIIDKR